MSKQIIVVLSSVIACLSMNTAAAYSMEAYCNQVMSTSSQNWIAKQKETLDGINRYSDCYMGKLDDTLRKLNEAGKGPLMGANGDFNDMQLALQKFTDTGLDATQANQTTRAYVGLYQQQFRNYFYQGYQAHPLLPTATSDQVSAAKAILEKELALFPEKKSSELKQLFNDFYNEATNLGMPPIAIYRHATFILKKPGSDLVIPAPF